MFKQNRVFGGKTYTSFYWVRTKREANVRADAYRAKGYLIRVIKESDGYRLYKNV
jgi:hypothetical protein